MHPHGATLQNSSRSSRHPWMAHRKILRLAAQLARIRLESQDVKEDVTRALTANGVMKAKQGSHLPSFLTIDWPDPRRQHIRVSQIWELLSGSRHNSFLPRQFRLTLSWSSSHQPPTWRSGAQGVVIIVDTQTKHPLFSIQNNRHCCPLKSFATPLFFLCD